MKIILEIKQQLFKDIYFVAGSAVGLYVLYNTGTIIEKCIHASKDNSTSIGVAKDIYINNGIGGYFKGTAFSIGYKVVLETLKDIHGKLYSNSSNGQNNNSSNNNSSISTSTNSNNNNIYNKIKNKFKFKNNSSTNNNNNSNNNSSSNSSSIINININNNNNNNSSIIRSTSSDNQNVKFIFNKTIYKSELLNIINELLECPLYLIRDCIAISTSQFKFSQFFKSLKSIHVIKLFGYYAGVCILKSYADVLIDVMVQKIQNSTDEKKSNSLFSYLKFIVLINNNLIIKSYLQSLILCPIDFIRIQYSLKVLEAMNLGVPIGSYVETSIPSPLAIVKRYGLSGLYNGFNISFINNIIANILVKYLYNIELILNLIIITKNIKSNKLNK